MADHPTRVRVGFASFAAVLASALAAVACETPVYRYAMYRWEPTPYEVYCFHEGTLQPVDQQIADLLREAARDRIRPANVAYRAVDLSEIDSAHLPPDVRQAWESSDERGAATYIVSTPQGVAIHRGPLGPSDVDSLLDSSGRKTLAKQLADGKIGVLVFVASSDEAANAAVRQVLDEVRSQVATGQVSLYAAPNEEDLDQVERPANDLGIVEVRRQDASEQWLVNSLLAAEPELVDDPQPMVFLAYGRGRVLLPYIGPGITRDNLLAEVQFIRGACSCTVKDQNPGVDLLIRQDWDSAAEELAARFGSEEGNESRFGGDTFLPELIIPSSLTETEEAAVSTSASAQPGGDEPREVAVAAADRSAAAAEDMGGASDEAISGGEEDRLATEATETGPAELASLPPTESASLPPTESAAAEFAEPPASWSSSLLVLGAGLVVALVSLFAVTLFVMRPQ